MTIQQRGTGVTSLNHGTRMINVADLDENLTKEDRVYNEGYDKGFDHAKRLKTSYSLPVFTFFLGMIIHHIIF